MKILEIIKGLDIGGINGGAERFGVDLTIALSKKGVPVDLCVFYRTGTEIENEWYKILAENKINVISLGKWRGNYRLDEFLLSTRKLKNHVNFRNYDILHSHTQFGTLASLLVKKRKCIRVVRTAHVTREWGETLYSRVQKFFWGEVIFPLFVDAQVAVSNAVKKSVEAYLLQRLIGKEVFVIYNSIPLPDEYSLSKQFRNGNREFRIGSVTRLSEQKGLIYLIEAASMVCRQNPNVKFFIAGEGELKNQLQNEIHRLGLHNHVQLIGKHPKIYEFLRQLDLFVLPSLWEGLPTVILEAMVAGIPVIATNIPGTDEIIENGENGWLVAPRSPTALANAIIEAICSPEKRERFIETGRTRVLNFLIDNVANEYIRLFERLLTR